MPTTPQRDSPAQSRHSLDRRQRALLVLHGVGLVISAALSGWLYFFHLLGSVELWPLFNEIPADIPGDRRAWNMAHLEGITNGVLLMAVAACAPFLRLSTRTAKVLFWSCPIFGWGFTLPAIANAWFRTRGLAMGGGPFGGSLANDLIFLSGWPPMIAAHVAFVLLAMGAWRGYRSVAAAA